jgi:hypothetical protein
MQTDPHPSLVRTRLARALGVVANDRSWRRAGNGERATALWLGGLPEAWHVFHDVPVGDHGGSVDHVAIGPGGVFTVSTKSVTGKLWVGAKGIRHNGHPTNFLSKAIDEARRASKLLSASLGRRIDVRAVLAILADEWTILEEPVDALVRGPRGAKNLMLTQPVTLSPYEVAELAAAAARPETWAAERRPVR